MLLVLGIEVKRKRTSDGGLGKMFHYHLATEAFWTDRFCSKVREATFERIAPRWQAIPHMGHTAKHVNFYFNYMPVEAWKS